MSRTIRGNTRATILLSRFKDAYARDIKQDIIDELKTIADVIAKDPDAEAKLSRALSEASVAICTYESKLGILSLCVEQHKAGKEKELDRNRRLAERITDYDTELHSERMLVKSLRAKLKSSAEYIEKLEEENANNTVTRIIKGNKVNDEPTEEI